MRRALRSTAILAFLVLAVAPASIRAASSRVHPAVVLRDSAGVAVTRSGNPVSPSHTCAGCHDTSYIESHSYHVDLGSGPLERWDPLTYAPYDLDGVDGSDAGIGKWVQRHGDRHVGGGFARGADEGDWDWERSGGVEMNCFLCHLSNPDNGSRIAALESGDFAGAATATLLRTGLVERRGDAWLWNRDAFDEGGTAGASYLSIGSPGSANCGQCHGAVRGGADDPFFVAPDPALRATETTGLIVSPHRIRRSGMNVQGKDELSRPWDVHAERLLTCTSCHPSRNNPAFFVESSRTRPEHMKFEARRLGIGDYLQTPSHDFSRGYSAQGSLGEESEGTMRRCEDCHDSSASHDWLPYRNRHMRAVLCESCHVPRAFAAAREQTDWTVLTPEGDARVVYRGAEGDPSDTRTLLTGFEPILLSRETPDGVMRLVPVNLMTAWYWRDDNTGKPVALARLKGALFDEAGGYRASVVRALDENGDGRLGLEELRLDSPAKVDAVRDALRTQGVKQASIAGEIRPYELHHGVAPGAWATRDCQSCHGTQSRFSREFELAAYVPGGITPTMAKESNLRLSGSIDITPSGTLAYRADPSQAGVYLLGFERRRFVDFIGQWSLVLVIVGVTIHGSVRVFLFYLGRERRAEINEEAR